MQRKIIWVGGILILILGVLIFFKENEILNGYFSTLKLERLSKYMKENYLYDIEEAKNENIYNGYLGALDSADTYYLTNEELIYAQAKEKGDTIGIGLELQWGADESYLLVTKVLSASPADKAGIIRGDHVLKINGIETLADHSSEISELVYSTSHEKITCVIKRGDKTFAVDLMPEEIAIEELKIEVMDEILYVDVESIKPNTSSKLEAILNAPEYSECKGLILDIRDLSTDNIEEIAKISDLFLEEDTIFKTQSKKEGVTTFKSAEGSYDIPLALITNQTTSAGIEALALALKGRATLLGGNTAGHATLKTIVPFEDGTGMSVASGIICDRYGEELSSSGIEPDIRLYISEEEKISLLENGYITKSQDSFLQKALMQFQ